MGYHDDPAINDALLTVINDGNGSQCGLTYEDRKQLGAEYAVRPAGVLRDFKRAARRYRRDLTPSQATAAARFLADYYVQHVRECQ
jgi:hypothetical protein